MRKIALITLAVLFPFLTGIIGWWIGQKADVREIKSSISLVKSKPFEKYSLENLAKATVVPGRMMIQETLEEEKNYTSYLFSFDFEPSLGRGEPKKSTGQINLPAGAGPYPIVVMLRGYIDQEIYETGMGTRKAAELFAQNGFITVAPDFLGYADSDSQAENIFEARFQTYTLVLTLLQSIKSTAFAEATKNKWDGENIFLWGHSNGGQIALTILAITGTDYPTTLWAPVSKSFPYSILYYTDESEDKGKYIRRHLSRFENLYDVELYSVDNYLDRINASLQIHQGTADKAVPVSWSNQLVGTLEKLNLDVTYYKYPGGDHNMRPIWDTVVARDLAFFKKNLRD